MTRFSEKIGEAPGRDSVQLGSMDDELSTRLWNVIHSFYCAPCAQEENNWSNHYDKRNRFRRLVARVWDSILKQPLDELPGNWKFAASELKDRYTGSTWAIRYDILEVFANGRDMDVNLKFRAGCNVVLAEELAGYRFVEGELVAVSNEAEVAEIAEARDQTRGGKFSGAHEALKRASKALFDRQAPDPTNAIKESVCAVEAVARAVSGEPKAKFSRVLAILEADGKLHESLKIAYTKIYAYASDEGGIRHGATDGRTVDVIEAKYFYISCSAFINYLISRAS